MYLFFLVLRQREQELNGSGAELIKREGKGTMSYGTKTIKGAAENLNSFANVLMSQLTVVGLKPKHEITNLGNCFRLGRGLVMVGVTARIYYKVVGDDIVVTPEITRSFWYNFLLPILLCILFVVPGVIYYIWTNRNMSRAIARVSFAIESSMSMYNDING